MVATVLPSGIADVYHSPMPSPERHDRGVSLLFLVLALLSLLAGDPGTAWAEAAFFRMDVPPHPETFVVKLRNPERIEQARRILSGEGTGDIHVMGRIVPRARAWNQPWSYRLRPRSVAFFEVAIEVCDASIAYVEEHLEEIGGAFLPGRVWCPWGSRLIEEIDRP